MNNQHELIVLYLDECHLVWDDARGYVWGNASERIQILMTNFRQRQTYYGTIEYTKGEVTVRPYGAGNGQHTVSLCSIFGKNISKNDFSFCGMEQRITKGKKWSNI